MRNIVFREQKEIAIVPDDKIFSQPREKEYRSLVEEFYISNENNIDLDKKILFLGDSVAQCLLMKPTDRMPSILERHLTQNEIYYSVLNAAVGGQSSLHCLLKFLSLMDVIPKPSIIILMSNVVDAECCLREQSFWNSHWFHTPIDPPLSLASDAYAENICNGIIQREKILLYFKYICDMNDITFITVNSPIKYKTFVSEEDMLKPTGTLTKLESIQIVNERQKEFCRENNILLIDIESNFEDYREKLFYDDVHLNEEGSYIVANIVFNELQKIIS